MRKTSRAVPGVSQFHLVDSRKVRALNPRIQGTSRMESGRVWLILAVMPRSTTVECDHGGQKSIILALPPERGRIAASDRPH